MSTGPVMLLRQVPVEGRDMRVKGGSTLGLAISLSLERLGEQLLTRTGLLMTLNQRVQRSNQVTVTSSTSTVKA